MNRYDVLINGESCIKKGILPVKRIDVPGAKKKYKEFDIAGIDGKYYEDTGFYDDIKLSVGFNYLVKETEWYKKFTECKRFFYNTETIRFTDDERDCFYKVKKIEVGTNERKTKKIGKVTITFICDPYSYLSTGLNEYDIEDVLQNDYELSKPIYKISGVGECEVTINGYSFSLTINGSINIDTDLMIAYDNDLNSMNDAISLDYDEIYLIEGKNTFSINEGFSCKVIPNWRVK